MKKHFILLLAIGVVGFSGTALANSEENDQKSKMDSTTIWMIGDSTMADYSSHPDYNMETSVLAGWGQVFQEFFTSEMIADLKPLINTKQVIVDDRAVGGRTARSFFSQGRWREVYSSIQPGDIVIIQFGHNDAGIKRHPVLVKQNYPKFVDMGYMEYLRFYVSETREKGGIPILLTPVARNSLGEDGKLRNTHGKFPDNVKAVAEETNALLIDLNQLSMDFFSGQDRDVVTYRYFIGYRPGENEKYPDGLKDNTHFKKEGAREVARIVIEQMAKLAAKQK